MKRLTMWVGLIIFFAGALPAFSQQTAETDAMKPEDYFSNGVELYETNDYQAAVAAFGKAMELKTDYPEAEYNLSITYWAQKDYPKAISTLESIVKKAPDTDIGKKAAADLKKLKEFTVPIVVLKTTEETEESGKEVDVTLKSFPELAADLKFGLLAKRIAATNQLRKTETDEAIKALIESALNENEKLAVRSSAVQNLARIKNPKAISAVDQALTGGFPLEEKFKFLVALANQNTPETFKIILKYWFLEKWTMESKDESPKIERKEWPTELADPRMWTMTKTLGKEESLPLFLSAWPGFVESTYGLMGRGDYDYIFYYNLMTGFLKGDLSIPVLVQRLKEDYPENYPVPPKLTPGGTPGGSPPPGFTGPIIKPSFQESPSWTVENEIKIRVEMVEVLGGVAGKSQGPFLEYLALNDPKTAVKNAASEAFKSLNVRVAQSTENYNKGLKLLESGNPNEAIPLFEQALKENYDSPYRKNITKNLVSAGLQFLAKGNKERATSLLMPLYQLLSAALAQETKNSKNLALLTPDAVAMGETKAPAADTEMIKNMLRNQLAVLEIPSTSVKEQDIQNIYDLGLELGIIKKPEASPGMSGMPGSRGPAPPPR